MPTTEGTTCDRSDAGQVALEAVTTAAMEQELVRLPVLPLTSLSTGTGTEPVLGTGRSL